MHGEVGVQGGRGIGESGALGKVGVQGKAEARLLGERSLWERVGNRKSEGTREIWEYRVEEPGMQGEAVM